MISIDGAYDLHVHSAPCLFPRIADDLTIAEESRSAGLRGLVLKSHHESTVGRAAVANHALDPPTLSPSGRGGDNRGEMGQMASAFTVYGSITLNHTVGGVNPLAVEAALKTGARFVWMPTIDSQAHADVFGHTGGWDMQRAESKVQRPQPLSILTGDGLIPEAVEVLRLCQEYDVTLATGHLGQAEILALAKLARQQHFERLVVTHPIFKAPNLTHAALGELTNLGAYFEFTYCTISPMWRHATIDETVAAIHVVGVERAYLSSDGGQPHNPMPHEGLRLLAQMCLEKGIAEAEVRRMICDTPAWLVGGKQD